MRVAPTSNLRRAHTNFQENQLIQFLRRNRGRNSLFFLNSAFTIGDYYRYFMSSNPSEPISDDEDIQYLLVLESSSKTLYNNQPFEITARVFREDKKSVATVPTKCTASFILYKQKTFECDAILVSNTQELEKNKIAKYKISGKRDSNIEARGTVELVYDDVPITTPFRIEFKNSAQLQNSDALLLLFLSTYNLPTSIKDECNQHNITFDILINSELDEIEKKLLSTSMSWITKAQLLAASTCNKMMTFDKLVCFERWILILQKWLAGNETEIKKELKENAQFISECTDPNFKFKYSAKTVAAIELLTKKIGRAHV